MKKEESFGRVEKESNVYARFCSFLKRIIRKVRSVFETKQIQWIIF